MYTPFLPWDDARDAAAARRLPSGACYLASTINGDADRGQPPGPRRPVRACPPVPADGRAALRCAPGKVIVGKGMMMCPSRRGDGVRRASALAKQPVPRLC
jgi:hypothetical protein